MRAMTLEALLNYTEKLGIELRVEDGRLRYTAPKGVLTPDLRAALVERKEDLLAALTERSRKKSLESANSVDAPLRALPRSSEMPLSFAQQRLWFLAQLEPDNPAYNIVNAIRLDGVLHVAPFHRCLQTLVARHEPLRTTFANRAGQPVQVIAPSRKQHLPVIDLSELSNAEREAVTQHVAGQDFLRPFDLARGPLLRTHLLRLGNEEHVLLLNMHHIASDGWSMGVLVNEQSVLYQAFLREQRSPLPDLPIQYADYAAWQRAQLQGPLLDTQLAYWRTQLADAPTAVLLPTDHPRPALPSFHGDILIFDIPPTLYAALNALSRREGVTLFVLLLAAFQLLLARYSGQRDIVLSTPIAGRNHSELEGLIGFFVNTLIMRTDLSGNPTFRELLQRVREVVLGAMAHQDLPFDRLVETLKPERNLSLTPFDHIAFALQNAPMGPMDLPGLRLHPLRITNNSAKSDLTLFVQEDASGPKGILEYSSDLFEAETIQLFANHYLRLLEQIVADPTQHIESLAILSESERAALLTLSNAPTCDLPDQLILHEYVEAQVRRTPDALALSFQGQQLTYLDLDQRANRLAHLLRAYGVGPETCVGLCLERSLEQQIALLAILKAGGVYVPLDPQYPPERLIFMLETASVPLLLTNQHIQARLPQYAGEILCLDTLEGQLSLQPAEPVISGVQPANLAALIYTSGSTGLPKGVAIPHRALVNHCLVIGDAYRLAATDRVLHFASLSFDVAAEELFPTWVRGGVVVPRPPQSILALSDFEELIVREHLTVVNLPAGYWHAWMAELARHGRRVPQELRHVIVGSERVLTEKLRTWFTLGGEQLQLSNAYGPTEATITATIYAPEPSRYADLPVVPIGRPIANTQAYVLDEELQPAPIGVVGTLYIGGAGLARGYLQLPELTAERFIPHPFVGTFLADQLSEARHGSGVVGRNFKQGFTASEPGERLYETGDRARYLRDGTLEFLGRRDRQVKVRGFRVELGEIEATLARHPIVSASVVTTRVEEAEEMRLVAYVVVDQARVEQTTKHTEQVAQLLQNFLKEQLPPYMLPSSFLLLDALPLLPGGKIDYRALPSPESGRPEVGALHVSPHTDIERTIAAIWQDVLHIDKVGTKDNFFDLGGHSLLLVQVHSRLSAALQQPVSVLDLFQYPTIAALAAHLNEINEPQLAYSSGEARAQLRLDTNREKDEAHMAREIAIVGFAGRFPQAKNVEQFWKNISAGVESIEFFTPEEMIAFGVSPAIAKSPAYVPAVSRLADVDLFDADFFGYSPREAELMDPQQRIFLECAWEALENAGYVPDTYPGAIGVYAGSSINSYFLFNVVPNQEIVARVGFYQAILGNEAAFLTTRTSYKLNLHGPSVNVNTACSTSLVAIHMACQSLLHGECDLALAGGVTVGVPQETGCTYVEGMITSPDGHCRAFDAQAKGTIGGNGVGLVVLKRLAEALRDGDCIAAIIKGSAINNDGSDKVGFTAPSVNGQAEVISEALAMAGVSPETIGYVEAHGTGTVLGDPIEVAALTQAYARQTQAKTYCAIGSVKSNIGHLDNAAGVAGLLKAVMALQKRQIPPTLHFERPNPKIDFAHSPFYVSTTLTPWETNDIPRRAGVSSFGIGGTNAHVILEEAPTIGSSLSLRPWQLVLLSARTATALEATTQNLAAHLEQHPEINLADLAYTSQVGRKAFNWRRILLCRDHTDALNTLQTCSGAHLLSAECRDLQPSLVFLFPGQGTQYPGMGRELYQREPVFRSQIDRCADLLKPFLGLDLRQLLYPAEEQVEEARHLLNQTANTQAALFTTEYALATLWRHWGAIPQAMLGHSIGEYVAACLAGVFTLEEALQLVAARGRLMQQLPPGSMLNIPLPAEEVMPLLSQQLSLAAVNGPSLCVTSGPGEAIDALREQLTARRITTQLLHTSHAFHSLMVEAIQDEFLALVRRVTLRPPTIPYISNLTGTWITSAEATSPAYWVRQMRQTVRFSAGVQELLREPGNAFLEVGPGRTLSTLVRQQGKEANERVILTSLPSPQMIQHMGESELLFTTLGRLWLAGMALDWPKLYTHERRLRVPLPTYPFERQRYWLEPPREGFGRYQATSDKEYPNGNAASPDTALSTPSIPQDAPEISDEPAHELARTIRVIWSELLGIEQIGLHDNFFELGGHSLMATQLVARLREIFPVEIPLKTLFIAPTIAGLAMAVEERMLEQLETRSDEEVRRLT